jgi:hypothetical protein
MSSSFVEPIVGNIVHVDYEQTLTNKSISSFELLSLCNYLYLFVATVLIVRLVLSLLSLLILRFQSKCSIKQGYHLIEAKVPNVFSFFNWIFIPKEKKVDIDHAVILHEQQHFKLFHSVDLILIEFLIVINWFNPFVYFFRSSLRVVHEFQVDNKLIKRGIKKSEYLNLMLNTIFYKQSNLAFQSNFNCLTIKKRVDMITKNKSSRISLVKYLLILPLVVAVLFSFAHQEHNGSEIINESTFPIDKNRPYNVVVCIEKTINSDKKELLNKVGLSFKTKEGTTIQSIQSGLVTEAGVSKNGKYIVINHGNGLEARYANNTINIVKKGDKVVKGQKIAEITKEGNFFGNHFYLEIKKDGKYFEPKEYLRSNGVLKYSSSVSTSVESKRQLKGKVKINK